MRSLLYYFYINFISSFVIGLLFVSPVKINSDMDVVFVVVWSPNVVVISMLRRIVELAINSWKADGQLPVQHSVQLGDLFVHQIAIAVFPEPKYAAAPRPSLNGIFFALDHTSIPPMYPLHSAQPSEERALGQEGALLLQDLMTGFGLGL